MTHEKLPRNNHEPDPIENPYNFDIPDSRHTPDPVDRQVARLTEAANDLFATDKGEESVLTLYPNGKEYNDFVRVLEIGTELSEPEKIAMLYMDSVALKYQAHNLIDAQKVLTDNNGETDDPRVALSRHMQLLVTDANNENAHNEQLLEAGVDDEGVSLSNERIAGIKGRERENKGRARDLMTARGDLAAQMKPEYAAASQLAEDFFNELTARRTGEAHIDDEAFTAMSTAMSGKVLTNIRIARGYAAAALSDDSKYVREGKAVAAHEIVPELEQLAQVSNTLVKRVTSKVDTQPSQPEENMVEEAIDDENEGVAPQAPAAPPSSVPAPVPRNKNPRNHRGPQPGQNTSSSTSANNTTAAPASGASGATPASAAPAGSSSNPNSANVDPAAQQEAEAKRKHERKLKAAEARYAACMQDFVLAGAQAGRLLFETEDADDHTETAHSRLRRSINNLMQLEHPEYFEENSDYDDDELAALKNAYYVEKHSAAIPATAEMMAEGKLTKFNKFVIKHKRALRLGAAGLGLVMGGVPGALLGNALVSGTLKFSKNTEANLEAMAKAKFNAGESLRAADEYIAMQQLANEEVDQDEVDRLIGESLYQQFEGATVKARRKAIIGSAATAAAWGGAVWLGGHMVLDGADYLWNGDGGVMDKLNHLDNPNGVTPWTPSAEKPWWMGSYAPFLFTLGGGALAAATAYKNGRGTKRSQNDYNLVG